MSVLSAKLTSKGQLTLPAELRRDLNLKAGDRVTFQTDASGRCIVSKGRSDWKHLVGMLDHLSGSASACDTDITDAVGEAMETQDRRAREG